MEDCKVYLVEKKWGRLPFCEKYKPYRLLKQQETDTTITVVYMGLASQKEYFKNIEGQITLETLFGQTLYNLMKSDTGPKEWVDVGAWNGHGTTTCILEGLSHRQDKEGVRIQSYEAHPFFYEIAKENLDEYSHLKDHFTLVNGRLPSTMPFPDGDCVDEKNDHYFLNFEEEKAIFATAEQIPVPFHPEVVILDGGEYCGYHDWESIPKQSLKHIFLDDINITKNRGVHHLLKTFTDWECITDAPRERNGWSYWRRKY